MRKSVLVIAALLALVVGILAYVLLDRIDRAPRAYCLATTRPGAGWKWTVYSDRARTIGFYVPSDGWYAISEGSCKP